MNDESKKIFFKPAFKLARDTRDRVPDNKDTRLV